MWEKSGIATNTMLVGCSGWSYDGWACRLYLIGLAKKRGEWLACYAQFFDTVEINSTYTIAPGGAGRSSPGLRRSKDVSLGLLGVVYVLDHVEECWIED